MPAVSVGGHSDETTASRATQDVAFPERARPVVVGLQAPGRNGTAFYPVIRVSPGMRGGRHGARLWCVESRRAQKGRGRPGCARGRPYMMQHVVLLPRLRPWQWIPA